MPNKVKIEADHILTLLLLLVSAVGIIVWNLLTPLGCDDLYFRHTMPESHIESEYCACMGRPIQGWGDAFATVWNVFLYDSGRWTNLLHILFVPLPIWVERCFSSLLLLFDIWLIAISGARTSRPSALAVALAIFGCWVILPWYDMFYSQAFQANYIWTSAVFLLFILYLRRATLWQGAKWWLFLALSAFLAEGHEGFGIVAGAFATGMLPQLSKLQQRRILWIILALFIGFCINLWSGTWPRLSYVMSHNSSMSHIPFVLTRWGSQLWPMALAAVISIIVLLLKKGQRRSIFAQILPFFTGMAAIAVISLVLCAFERSLWPGDLLAIIVMMRMTGSAVNNRSLRAHIGIACFIVAYSVWLGSLIIWQKRMKADNDALMAGLPACLETRSNILVGPYLPTDSVPAHLMGIVSNPIETCNTHLILGAYICQGTNNITIVGVEPSMSGPFDTWPVIEGDMGLRGVWPWVAGTDTTAHAVRLRLGPPSDNMTLINKAITRLKEGANPGETEITLKLIWHPVYFSDGSVVYSFITEPLPRTKAGREVLRADRAD